MPLATVLVVYMVTVNPIVTVVDSLLLLLLLSMILILVLLLSLSLLSLPLLPSVSLLLPAW